MRENLFRRTREDRVKEYRIYLEKRIYLQGNVIRNRSFKLHDVYVNPSQLEQGN